MIEGERPKHKKMYNYVSLNNRAKNKKWNKLFCIGLNKTGTTSLHCAFQKLGLKSFHGGTYDYRIDAFSDGRYYKSFEELYRIAPNSLFILNTRNLRDWIHSRIKHCMQGHYTPGWENDTRCDPDRIREWVEERHSLYNKIYEFFILSGKENQLLVFDVCSGDNYQKLCPFLGLSRIAEKFPKSNKRTSKLVLTKEQQTVILELEELETFKNPFLKND